MGSKRIIKFLWLNPIMRSLTTDCKQMTDDSELPAEPGRNVFNGMDTKNKVFMA